MTRTSRAVIQVVCAFPAMCEHCSCQHVKCCSFLIGGLSNVLLLFVIRLIEICTCCYPPLIIHAQICEDTCLSVSSSNAGGVGEPAPGGEKMTPWVPVCFRAFRPPLPGRLAKKTKALSWSLCVDNWSTIMSWIPFGDHPSKLERYRED